MDKRFDWVEECIPCKESPILQHDHNIGDSV